MIADVTGDNGTTSIIGDTTITSTGSLVQKELDIDDAITLTNAGSITVKNTLSNSGEIANSGNVYLYGTTMTNGGDITGTGTTTIGNGTNAAALTNTGNIGNAIVIATNGTLTTDLSKLTGISSITNSGLLNLTTTSPTNLNRAISGAAGVTNIQGNITANSTIANKIEITSTGYLTATTDKLTNTNALKNAGTLEFNNTADGVINSDITNNTTNGLIKINTADEKKITLNKTISNNTIELLNGTLLVNKNPDAGDIGDISSATIKGGDGILSFADGVTTGTGINMGTIDLSATGKDVNVSIDVDILAATPSADKLSGTVLGSNSKIQLNEIALVTTLNKEIPSVVTIATGDIISAIDATLQNVRVTNDSGEGGLSISYNNTNGQLTLVYSTIYGAISSSVENKTYALGTDTTVTQDLGALNGTKLTLTGHHSLDGNNKQYSGLTIGNGQTLSMNVITGMDNFATAALTGEVGSTLHLTDITFGSGNDVAVNNNGTMKLEGTNLFNSSVIGNTGTTTIKNGQTTANAAFTQGDLNVGVADPESNGEFVNNSTVTVTNLNVNTAGSTYTNNNGKTTNVTGTLTNKGTVDNKGSIIGNVANQSGGTINNTSGVITGNVTNAGESAPIAGDAGVINTHTTGIVGDVANDGILKVSGGTVSAPQVLGFDIDNGAGGTGETYILGVVNTPAARAITQATLNIGDATGTGTDGILNNGGLAASGGGIIADSINIATANSKLNNTGDITINALGAVTNIGTITNDGENALITGGTINNSNYIENKNGAEIASAITNAAGGTIDNTATISGKITNANMGLSPAGIVNTTASGITGGVDNDGILTLTGGTSATPDNLGSEIDNGLAGAGVTNIAGVINTNGNNITQKTVNVGKNSAGADVAGAALINSSTVTADNVNVTAGNSLTLANGSTTTVADAINVAAGGSLTYTDDAVVNGTLTNGITITNGTLNLDAATTDLNLTNDITGAGVNGVQVNVKGAGTTTISSAITNAVNPVSVANGSTLALNDNGSILQGNAGSQGSTINLGTNSSFDINSAAGRTVDNNVTAVSGSGASVNLNNDGSNSTITLNNTITGVDNVNLQNGKANIGTNTDGKTSTSQTLGTATLNIAAGTDADITTTAGTYNVNNNITGNGNTSKLILSGNPGTAGTTDSGTRFTINNPVSNAIVEIASGELYLPNDNNFVNNSQINANTNTTVNTMDGTTSIYNTIVNFADDSQVKIDINALTGDTDKFANAVQNPGDSVTLTDINLQGLNNVTRNNLKINLSESTNIQNIKISDNLKNQNITAMTPIRRMAVKFTDDGNMQIIPSSGHNNWKDYNPAILATPVAAQIGGYLMQLNSYDEAFRNMDMYMLMSKKQRQAMKFRNKIAAIEAADIAFDPTMAPMEQQGAWFRPFATFEKVGLHNGPKVGNIAYGTFLGGESELKDLGHGWDGAYGAYIGYNGSQQSYSGVSTVQNGGTLGIIGMAYKDNFFVGGTINAGANTGEANTAYGHENFNMITAGIAAKVGYNWELLDGVFIVQPSMIMSYSFVNTLDYTNSAGVRVSSSPLNAIQMEPGIKFIGNLNNGWQPYAGISMIFNLMDKNEFMANDISLPSMSIKPYVKYGVGVRRTWGGRFTGFFQTFLTNGGRNGVGLQAGFRWAVGKDHSETKQSKGEEIKTEKVKAEKPVKENTVKTKTEKVKTKKAKVSKNKINNNSANIKRVPDLKPSTINLNYNRLESRTNFKAPASK